MPVPRVLEPAPDLSYGGRGASKPGVTDDGGRSHAPRVLERSVDLSYGDQGAGNLVIEGDNLQVMVSLRPQYRSMIDVAYLDPPYNTGKKDFRYSDRRFADPNADSDDAVYVTNEDGGRHTKWLNYMAPRLHLTHELLADHGICFISINDIELFRLGMLMDEIFGERNKLGVLIWKQGTDNNPTRISTEHEYILCYAKRIDDVPRVWLGYSAAKAWMLSTFEELRRDEPAPVKLEKRWQAAIKKHVAEYKAAIGGVASDDGIDLGALERYKHVDRRGPYASIRNTDNPGRPGYYYDVLHPETGLPCKKPATGYRFPPEKMQQLRADDMVVFGKDHNKLLEIKKYLKDVKEPLRSNSCQRRRRSAFGQPSP
jgi:adenine-specific DNA-methyltransferase